MTWPTTPVVTSNVDAPTDLLANARPDIQDAITKLNAMIAHVTAVGAAVMAAVDAAAGRTAIGAAAAASPSFTGLATITGGAFTPSLTPAHSATPTFDADASNVFEPGALTGNVSSITINNPHGGQSINIRFVQDAAGGRTVAVPAGAVVSGAINPTASKVSWLFLTYSAAATRWEGAWSQLP